MGFALALRDGVSVPIQQSGAGWPVIFIHGWAMNGALFDGVRALLEQNFNVLAYDLRGHGQFRDSPAPTIEQLGADLSDILVGLDAKNAVLVGWSMGAMVAWEAVTDPETARRVAGLVSIDMSPRITNDRAWSLGLADGRRPDSTLRAVETMRDDWNAMTARFVPRIFAKDNAGNLKQLIASIIDDARRLDGAVMADLWQSMAVQDFRKSLKQIETPMLAIHGAKSQLYPISTGEFIAESAPHAKLSVFEQSGHAPHLEEAARFAAVLTEFVNRLGPPLETVKPMATSAH